MRTPWLFIAGLAFLAACSSSKPSLTVPLAFHPEREVPGRYPFVTAAPSLKLFVAPVSDDRADKTKIGENTEVAGIPPRPIYSAGATPAEFVGSVLARELSSVGMAPVPEPQANRVLSVRLVRFYTTESTRYFTDVAATAEVRDAAGRVLWSGQSAGQSDRFGRSLSPENYNEGFSDATLQMVSGIVNDPGFRKAIATE
jgi:hypothetical protein